MFEKKTSEVLWGDLTPTPPFLWKTDPTPF